MSDWLDLMMDDHPFTLVMLILAVGVVILILLGWALEWWTERKR